MRVCTRHLFMQPLAALTWTLLCCRQGVETARLAGLTADSLAAGSVLRAVRARQLHSVLRCFGGSRRLTRRRVRKRRRA